MPSATNVTMSLHKFFDEVIKSIGGDTKYRCPLLEKHEILGRLFRESSLLGNLNKLMM